MIEKKYIILLLFIFIIVSCGISSVSAVSYKNICKNSTGIILNKSFLEDTNSTITQTFTHTKRYTSLTETITKNKIKILMKIVSYKNKYKAPVAIAKVKAPVAIAKGNNKFYKKFSYKTVFKLYNIKYKKSGKHVIVSYNLKRKKAYNTRVTVRMGLIYKNKIYTKYSKFLARGKTKTSGYFKIKGTVKDVKKYSIIFPGW